MKSIFQVTSYTLFTFGVSEVTAVEWLQIATLLSSLVFSMYKLYITNKYKK